MTYADLTIEDKLKLLSLASARKKTGVLNPNSKAEIEERKAWLEKCKNDFESFCIEALHPMGFKPAAHHRLLIKYLEMVAAGDIKRLMVCMPPGSAKSTYASHLFPAWLYQRNKNYNIIGASHTTNLALDFSAKIQNYIVENESALSYHLKTEQKQRWFTSTGGSYLAAGVGSAIPGYRASLGIIDDPVRGRDAVENPSNRDITWNWYLGSFERRLTPDAPIILILTRWHEDDLAGRLLEIEPDKWVVVNLPAEAEEGDLLGRVPGEWLWEDDDYGFGASLPEIKAGLEAAGASREWSAQYQQHPRPLDGSIFNVSKIMTLEAAPAGTSVRAWDLAATEDVGKRDPSWTRGVKMTKTSLGRFVVEDVASIRGKPEEVERLILNTASQDGKRITISLPQDPGQAGKSQIVYLTKKLAGYTVQSSPESGSKATRASPFASQVNIGNVDLVLGAWNKPYRDELAGFPSAAHEDQVDASSRAFSMLLEGGMPIILSEQIRQRLAVNARNRLGRVRI
jgi:predicted phage terminase large subunit-like protein